MYITLINLWVLFYTRESKIRAQIPPTIVYKTLEANYTRQKTFYTKHHHAFANSNLSSAPSLASSASFADISPFVSHSSGQIFTSKSLGLILPSSAARRGSATAGSSMTDFIWPPAIYEVFAVAWLNKGNFRIAVSMDGTQKPWGYDEMMSLKQRQRYMLKNIKLSSAIMMIRARETSPSKFRQVLLTNCARSKRGHATCHFELAWIKIESTTNYCSCTFILLCFPLLQIVRWGLVDHYSSMLKKCFEGPVDMEVGDPGQVR